MKKHFSFWSHIALWGVIIISGFVMMSAFSLPEDTTGKEIAGIWQGKLKVQGMELRIVFRIQKIVEGNYKATMDSPDQGATGIPVSKVILKGDTLYLEVQAISGNYRGVIHGNEILGQWSQRGMSFPLNLRKKTKPTEVKRPQEPRPPFPYQQREVKFLNARAKIHLSGTLTLPRGKAPFPAVVLISGSGPQDRDETIFGHKPFLVLADYLTRQGIAVLRFDDRGVGNSEGDFASATTEDFASDVEAAIDYLKQQKAIRKDKIGLIGHSEGAMIAAMIAAHRKDIAFIVLMACPGLPGDQLLYLQNALITKAQGLPEKIIQFNQSLLRESIKLLKSKMPVAEMEQKLNKFASNELKKFSPQEMQKYGIKEKMIQTQIKQLSRPWFRFFISYDPRSDLSRVRCPVLALYGEKDLQVPPKQNVPEVEKALSRAGNSRVTIKIIPGVNHLFQPATTGSPAEYGRIETTISPRVLKLFGDWIRAKIK